MLRNKVPEVTAIFWITKVLTTAMGETTSDFMVHQIDPPVAVAIGFVVLAASLVLQFAVKRYLPWVYWFAVVMVSVFGTMVADVIHVQFGVPYAVSTVGFLVALAAIFALWYATQKTLSIHSIDTRPRELFYWAAVLATFALGTAAGDLTATTFHLGYFASGILFAVIIAIPAIGFRFWGWNGVFSFWFAYIITRPLGASFSDWLGLPPERGGVGIGTGLVSAVLTVAIIVCVGIMNRDHKRASRVPALAVNASVE
ncbi:COG4705 family protein [Diaminobutyricibacter tongyongensis]|uniref:COG4705 family protein n=1 Tax=Leifsonia tongyongensis TaxID=1268043 RepID=UPI0030842263